MLNTFHTLTRFALVLFVFTSNAPADEPLSTEVEFSSADIEFFEQNIRTILSDNCYECHSGLKAKVGLQLDRRAGWLKGSDYRPVIDLSSPSQSLVIQAVSHIEGKDIPAMPDEGEKLSETTISLLTEWISRGLPWPIDEKENSDDPALHWSFQPVAPESLPAKSGHPIDFFISRAQQNAGLSPAPKADRQTRYRRISFDLLGLPPQFAEQQKFLDDPRPDNDAWAAVVNQMLASPHYGERFARHWMDVARYSDTKGYEAGGRERRFVHSYSYRDWLIRSFNQDLPYDQFLLYQLAAEQLVDWAQPEKKHLAALGFIALSKSGGAQELVIDDRLDTTFRGTMALTVACARCHDHKFDPVSTQEYYSLYGVFANSMEKAEPTIGNPKSGPAYEKYLAEKAEKQKAVDDFVEPRIKELAEQFPNIANRRIQLIAKLSRQDKAERDKLQRIADNFVVDSAMEADKAIIVKDRTKALEQAIFIRGNPARRGEIVPRQFLSIASSEKPQPFTKGSGRLEMAQAIVHPQNPLTARNIVNRVWMWHFGEGIVRTIDDFGIQGEKPDHPELLDWLAHWFIENGWSIKKLNHLILTSRAWQQSSSNDQTEANMPIDPENRLHWKFNRKRLDLEQMRDGLLQASGTLNGAMFGRPVKILEPPFSNRRSVYAFIDRQNLNPVFRNFDFSNPQETTGQRSNTTIPMQALFTLNSDFAQNQAKALANSSASSKDRVAHLHRTVFTTDPSDADRQLADSFITAYQSESSGIPPRQTDSEWSYGWGHVDETSGKVTFHPFPHWTGARWQMAEEFPLTGDPRAYLYSHAGASHPGTTAEQSSISRWVAPADLEVTVRGRVDRQSEQGNGVQVKVVTTSNGIVFNKLLSEKIEFFRTDIAKLTLKEGDSIYFIVESHQNNSNSDSFNWNPVITDLSGRWSKWNLEESFSGPSETANAWSAYAHALLNANRFLFID
tara:strand:- start:588 stop:3461 length:2874 start_codon:yes stop_codon:yes gene_type:complete